MSLQSLNYAPIAVGVVLLVSGGWWVADAHKWFHGPRRTLEDSEDPTPDPKAAVALNKDVDVEQRRNQAVREVQLQQGTI